MGRTSHLREASKGYKTWCGVWWRQTKWAVRHVLYCLSHIRAVHFPAFFLRVPPRSPLGGTSVAIETTQCGGSENCKRGGAPRAQGSTASGPAQSCSDHAARFTDGERRGCSQWLERLAAQTSNSETLCVVRPQTPVSYCPSPTSAHRTQPSVTLSAAPSVPL